MGEAKKRGTFEQRRENAIKERETKMNWIDKMQKKRARVTKWEIFAVAFSFAYVLAIVSLTW